MSFRVPISSSLTGRFSVPADKSIGHRAAMIASLAEGDSIVRNFPEAADPQSTAACLRNIGAEITAVGRDLRIRAKGPRGFRGSKEMLDAGNSGTTIRLLSGILSAQSFPSVIGGDVSLARRPMRRIVDPLRTMGADISVSPEGTLPVRINPVRSLSSIDFVPKVPSAQVKSAVLLAGLFAEGTTTVREAVPTRDHTERMLGLKVGMKDGFQVASVTGGHRVEAGEFRVPGDPSAAAFIAGAALLIPGSDVQITDVCLNSSRIAFVDALKSVGAAINVEEATVSAGEQIGILRVRASRLEGTLEVSGALTAAAIDEIPLLAVVAAVSGCGGDIRDAKELRAKECDRIRVMVQNLRSCGCDVEEREDGFSFAPGTPLRGATIETADDHRIAMAFGVAGMRIPDMVIDKPECVAISFPEFWETMSGVARGG